MTNTKKYLLFAATIIAALLVSSCGGEGVDAESAIQTSVAETVAAQTPVMIPVTETPDPSALPTKTPFAAPSLITPVASPTLSTPSGSSKIDCAKASLEDESIIDGVVLKPGEQFTKTWYIKNTSTCVWDTSYRIIFWSGDPLGGAYYYNLPQATGPGQTVPISLVLTAPTEDGTYRSEWKLQTPDQISFGVGIYQAAFFTEITVDSSDKPKYGITNVNLYVIREPKTGCAPANMVFTAYAEVSTSGPYEFTYFWGQKDGNNSSPKTVYIDKSTTTTFTRVWKFGRAASQGPKWFTFVVTDPVQKEYRVDFAFECP
ncbi:MAG: hypothetical protein C4557_11845 [Anaerolineaceae bacterium]|jgi:hypothetical protein|nr:MAG: hypothetical protein C4557_11845 [Anaerolineaceae bacterium]